MASNHQQKLSRVCRICGNLLGKDSLKTDSKIDRIYKAFRINVSEDFQCIHPEKMCMKCYTSLRNIENRGSKVFKAPKIWVKCPTVECKCVFGIPGRKPLSNVGRPGKVKKWTKFYIKSFLDSLPIQEDKEILTELNHELNPHIVLCICKICGEVMNQPVMLKNCQHSFCSLCILSNVKDKLENDSNCPLCKTNITIDSLSYSVHISEIIKHLTIICKICDKKVFLKDRNFENHDCIKLSNNTINENDKLVSINSFYQITDTSEIPREVNDAVLHIIKKKLNQSKTSTIEFSSGGPRSLCFVSAPKAYKDSANCSNSSLRNIYWNNSTIQLVVLRTLKYVKQL